MMQTGVIINRKAGKTIPAAYLELAVKANPKVWGVALISDDKLNVNHGEDVSIGLINDTMESFPDTDFSLYLGTADAAISTTHTPPFVLISDSDGESRLVIMVDGNFPGFSKKDSSHPAEYHFTTDYIIPKIDAMAEMCDGDLDKLMKAIGKDIFKKELLGNAVSRGVVTFIADTGENLTFAMGDASKEYEWGWVSNHYGFEVAGKTPEKKEEAPKPRGMFPKKSTVREPASASVSSVQPPKADPKSTTAVKAPPAAEKKYSVKKDKPGGHLSRSAKKDWYKARIGYCPPNWERCCEIEFYIDDKGQLITHAQVKKMGLDAAALPALNNPGRDENRNNKDTSNDHIESPEKEVQSPDTPPKEMYPILSPAAREHLKKYLSDERVKKIISENATIVQDPEVVQGIEAKFASFSSQLGLKDMNDFMALPFPEFMRIGTEKLEALAVMCWTFRNMAAHAEVKKNKKTAPAAEEKKEPVSETPATPKRTMFPKKAA